MDFKLLVKTTMTIMAVLVLVSCGGSDPEADDTNDDGTTGGGETSSFIIQGLYAVNSELDTCTTGGDFAIADSTDRDDLCLDIDDGEINRFFIDDDETTVIQLLSTQLNSGIVSYNIDFTFQAFEDSLDCELSFDDDGDEITGSCEFTNDDGTHECTLAYVRVSTDDTAFVDDIASVDSRAVAFPDNNTAGCGSTEGYSDFEDETPL